MTPRRDRREGIVLLELVTALVIVSVGLLGIVQMYQIGVAKVRESQRRTIALHALDNEIETLRALPRSELPQGRNLPWRSDPAPIVGLHDAEATVDIQPYAPNPDLMSVVVRIRWREGGRAVRREVATLMGARP